MPIKLNEQTLCADGEVGLWPERDLLQGWKPAQEDLHANTCMVFFLTPAILAIYPCMHPSLASLMTGLLLLGAGSVPSFVWMSVHAVLAGLPMDVPEGYTWSQLAAHSLVHAPARKAQQAWKRASCCLQRCLRSLSPPAPGAPSPKGQDQHRQQSQLHSC